MTEKTSDWLSEVKAEFDEKHKALSSAVAEKMAVLGTFDPRVFDSAESRLVLRTIANPVRDEFAETAKQNSMRGANQHWFLNESARVHVFARIMRDRGAAGLPEIRAETPVHNDSPIQRALDSHISQTFFDVSTLNAAELDAAMQVRRWMSNAASKAGISKQIELGPSEEEMAGRIKLLQLIAPIDRLLTNGCVGRDVELERIHKWRNAKSSKNDFAEEKILWVHGIGGMGKSTLLARFIRDLFDKTEQGERCGWAYVDFDRPILRKGLASDVLDEMLRQIGTQFPELQRKTDDLIDRTRSPEQSEGLESFDRLDIDSERVYFIGTVLEEILHLPTTDVDENPFVLVLDTFEELERMRDEYHQSRAASLMETLFSLSSQVARLRVLVSGRSQPGSSVLVPNEHIVPVEELKEPQAKELLNVFVRNRRPEMAPLPQDLSNSVIRLVGGSPLTLKLAARVLVEQGQEAVEDAALQAAALGEVRNEFVAGFLYQRVIDHLQANDPKLRQLLRDVVRAGLTMRRINVQVVEHVLLPALGQGPDPETAKRIFESMGVHTSLHQTWDQVTLVLHEDLRRPALAALKYDDAELVDDVHQRAIEFLKTLPDEWAGSEVVYHRLMSNEPPDDLVDELTPDVIGSLVKSIADLPPAAADVISMRRSEVAATLRKNAEARSLEISAESHADTALRNGDVKLARQALQNVKTRLPTSKLFRVESRIHEAEGNIDLAIEAQGGDLRASQLAGHARRTAAAAVRLAELLELHNENEKAIKVLAEAEQQELLHGHIALRLELLLRRLNTAERRELWDQSRRKTEQQAVILLIDRWGNTKLTENKVLLRLGAAAFGRQDPGIVADAIVRAGFPSNYSNEFFSDLARAMALSEGFGARRQHEIEQDFLKRGRISASDILRIYTDAINKNQEEVMEAVRGMYLWWNLSRKNEADADGQQEPLFQINLDWKRSDVRELADLLAAAYPKVEHVRRLVDVTEIEGRDSLPVSKQHSELVRDVMQKSAEQGKLEKLIVFASEDEDTTSFRDDFLKFLSKKEERQAKEHEQD